ncbi:MAG: tripartite tricarboxylate transporter TctB family protein [Dehalococcoidia bacterium]|nr:tripartite tricarboxylate transporter TctB family protein [Dehalococcoidia bacterium]
MLIRLIFSSAILAFMVILVLYTFQYSSEAKIFPWVVGIPSIILMSVHIIRLVVQKQEVKAEVEDEEEGLTVAGVTWRNYLSIISWVLLFLIMILFLGFFVTIPLYFFLYQKLHGGRWLSSVLVAAGSIIIIYVIFTTGMKLELYPGLLYKWVLTLTNTYAIILLA